jgi:hypothetical protein
MTREEAMHKVSAVLSHPAFSRGRPDVVTEISRTDGVIRISGPQAVLDGFVPALRNVGLEIVRPAPATMLIPLPVTSLEPSRELQ